MIELESVSKVFKGHAAVDQLSLRIEEGEVIGLLGENGAGKTTTLRMISTVIRPTSGVIRVHGIDTVARPADVRRRIGILFGGETGLYERLTARENIAYFGRLFGMDKATLKQRIDDLAEQFNMTDFLDKKAGGFSKGMKQKTAIARAVVHDPDVILFDEPTSGLDITSANRMRQLIRDFRNRGKTILFSSHIMSEVERLCDRVAILHKGKLRYIGTLQKLYERENSSDLDRIFMRIVGEAV